VESHIKEGENPVYFLYSSILLFVFFFRVGLLEIVA